MHQKSCNRWWSQSEQTQEFNLSPTCPLMLSRTKTGAAENEDIWLKFDKKCILRPASKCIIDKEHDT